MRRAELVGAALVSRHAGTAIARQHDDDALTLQQRALI
jgi:hypothetical protein